MLKLLGGALVFGFLLVVPGYFLVLGFFPRRGEISRLERWVFSVVFSLTFLPLALLLGNQLLRMPVNAETVLGLSLFLVLLGILTFLVRIGKVSVPKALNRFFPMVKAGDAVSPLPWK
ncbi:MAG TPA: DUF1616 domain-containing protein [Candidatus Diapherotrites archaeon]|uniref:DUF1616 domain-containing protein n=1 Tax=Candidatus Iainarchaeum sp. TaxID=3101447 RepID=A0A7J4JH99_9ARCH|nr:DUF1616 domain-containing protein [Candidatus Diapherotrites archaeon]HIH17131.1 DUF1616 domain-containing protein [Candidatus Diapherotrites archaeon]